MSALPASVRSRVGPVPASFIDPDVRAVADAALVAARAELGLWSVPIDVRWFSGAPFSAGFIYGPEPTTVWLSASLADCAPHQIVEVVGHELAHVADHVRGRPSDEPGALRFGERLAARLHPAA